MNKVIVALLLLMIGGLAYAAFDCNQYDNPNLVRECRRIQNSLGQQNQTKPSIDTQKQTLSPTPGATQPTPSFETNSPVVPITPPPSQVKPIPDTQKRIRLFY